MTFYANNYILLRRYHDGIFSLSKKQYNKQQAVGYVVYMMVGSYFHAEDLPRKFHNFHLHYAELPEVQKGKIADQVICQMDKLDTKFLQEIALLRCEVVSFYEGEKLCLVFSTCGFGEIRCWITKDGWFELSSREAT